MAINYDRVFTNSWIGRAQRGQVWRVLRHAFKPGERVLELNCGTGEDALFLARRGVSVFATDVSAEMIRVARGRHAAEAPQLAVLFERLAIEELHSLVDVGKFDGVFSNFSGLNCVADLHETARELARLLVPRAAALLCFSTRVCAWETLWFLLHGQPRKACRRWSGSTTAFVHGEAVPVHYPSLTQLRRAFEPWFQLRSVTGIGVLTPPTYVEEWMRRHVRFLSALDRCDRWLGRAPLARVVGDHMLLHFERTVL
jgi:ubiquinone/menaquinone biosynthesis C-methylase UbiE